MNVDFSNCLIPSGQEFWLEKMRKLYELLIETNRSVNLTRIVDENEFWIKHIYDSLLLLQSFPELAERELKLADIGTGAGFPSLVLATAVPKWRITAIDSIGKKTAFVRKAAEELELSNLEVVTGRARELNCKAEFARRFDIITARAVAPSPGLWLDVNKMVKGKGFCAFYKTPEQATEELEVFKEKRFLRPGRSWRVTQVTTLPDGLGSRCLVTDRPLGNGSGE